jgi:hypothetical protein
MTEAAEATPETSADGAPAACTPANCRDMAVVQVAPRGTGVTLRLPAGTRIRHGVSLLIHATTSVTSKVGRLAGHVHSHPKDDTRSELQ